MERRHELPGSITGGRVEPLSARDRTRIREVNVRIELEANVLSPPVELDSTNQQAQQLLALLVDGGNTETWFSWCTPFLSPRCHSAVSRAASRSSSSGHRMNRLGVEGLVLERKALRGGSHAPRCACGTLRTHDCRRLHRGDLTVGGSIGAGAGPDIKHGPRIAERSPDLRGDPRLGAPRHRLGDSDGVIQLLAGHDTAFPAVSTAAHARG
jgi:hypothetical protein